MRLGFVLCAAVLLVAGCGGDAPLKGKKAATSASGASSSQGGAGRSLSGSWTYEFESTGCKETFSFSASGSFTLTSLDEVASGSFTSTQLESNPERYRLSLSYTGDNGLPNCQGISDFKTGSFDTDYFEFGSSVLNFYGSAGSTSISRVYRKGR